MKKLLTLSLLLLLLSLAASAQINTVDRVRRIRVTNSGSITKIERLQLYRDQLRYKIVQRNARRDGIITPAERRKTQKARRKCRVDSIRFRNNGQPH